MQCVFLGVVWTLTKPIEEAGEGIASLQENGKRVIFISNNSVRSNEKYVDKFKEGNLNASMVWFANINNFYF